MPSNPFAAVTEECGAARERLAQGFETRRRLRRLISGIDDTIRCCEDLHLCRRGTVLRHLGIVLRRDGRVVRAHCVERTALRALPVLRLRHLGVGTGPGLLRQRCSCRRVSRRLMGFGVLVLVAVAVAGCGSGVPEGDANTHLAPATGAATTSGRASSSSPPGDTPCLAQVTSEDPLTAFGATFAAWSAHHEVDPNRPDFFLPFLNDGVDRYTRVRCTGTGRVVGYYLNFAPPVTLEAGKRAFRAELPADAVLVYDTVDNGCAHIQYRSAALARALGAADPDGVADAAIILPYDPAQQSAVSTIFIDSQVPLTEKPTTC
jgi:hypothetical protein